MKFENAFVVPLPPAEAWKLLMDIERIAPCMPGAELTGKVDDRTYKGKVGVKLGPVALSFAGTAAFDEIDEVARRARIKASGADQKGRGGANALATFRVEPSAEGSRVVVDTDLSLSGTVAQYGRGVGIIQEVASQLIKQFAAALAAQLAVERAPIANSPVAASRPAVQPVVRPVSGFSLFFAAFWSTVRRKLRLGPAG